MSGFGNVIRDYRRWAYVHKRRMRRIGSAVSVVVALAAAGAGLWWVAASWKTDASAAHSVTPPTSSFAARATVARDEGRYADAATLIAQGLATSPADHDLLTMDGAFKQDLVVDFDFGYLRGQRMPMVQGGDSTEVELAPDDAYFLTVDARTDAYLYVFQVNASGTVVAFCPNRAFVPNANPVPAGRYRIPDGYGYLHVPPAAGTEKLYLIATRWPHREFERLAQRAIAGSAPEGRQLADAIEARMMIEQAATDSLPGLTIGSYTFRNLGGGHAAR